MKKTCVAVAVFLVFGAAHSAAQEELSAKELSKLEDGKTVSTPATPVAGEAANAPPKVPEKTAAVTKPDTAAPAAPEPAAEASVEPKPAPVSEPVEEAAEAPEVTAAAAVAEAPVPQADQVDDGRPAPLPVAMTQVVLDVCVPTLRGERSLFESLPEGAESGATEDTLERFIAAPQAGDMWTLPTLEGPMLLGNLHAREGACQVMGASPLGDLVMEKVSETLLGLDSPFEIADETGAEFAAPLHWRRFVSAERDFIDVLHYKGVPGGQVSTIHVIVG